MTEEIIEVEKEKKELLPNWLIKSLAWAFIAGGVAWVSAIQGQIHEVDKKNTEQDVKDSAIEERVTGNDKKTDTHFQYIRDALNRIEARQIEKEIP